jgi:Tol biopolymer transport system component
MALPAGTLLGPYKIVSAIGAGGMGEVYKATDTRLNRTVALKVLPTHFSADPEMKQRFDREAQTIAGLNHPNICVLHDVGRLRADSASPDQPEVDFLVMEFVEGETLADRLARGPLPVDEALRIAGELADALDRAHRQGVVHRDLKPANIMLARSGTSRQGSTQVKILDFGLAKFTAPGEGGIAAQATRMDVTSPGTMLGTLQYMAPEQIEGREADARTDIFAFGGVLYEILTGKRAFEGKSQASLIGAIMKAEPRPIAHTQPLTPAVLERVIARCLAKDPDDRWQDAHSLRIALASIAKNRGQGAAVVEAPRWRQLDVALLAVGLLLTAGAAVPAYITLRGSPEAGPTQFRHTTVGLIQDEMSLSPNGETIAFVAKPDSAGGASLFIRPVRGVTSVKLAGTDDATQPFWSPDSNAIAFVSGGKLKRVDASGGAAKDLCSAEDFSGGSWTAADGGTIVFGTSKGLMRVSAEGGPPALVTTLSPGETGHFWPDVLPDGRHLLYLAWSADAATRGIYLASLDSKDRTKLIAAESNARYAASGSRDAAPGYIFFQRESTLFAQPFDARTLAFTGNAAHAADGVRSAGTGRGIFDVSQNGVLLYFQSASGATGRAGLGPFSWGWIDRGKAAGVAIEDGTYGDMDLSPDGKLVAVTRGEGITASADIWVIDWEKDTSVRLTTDPADDVNPIWAPDGTRVAFTTWRKGNADIYVKNANNVGPETPLLEGPENEEVKDWSHDGRMIAFMCGHDAFADICALPVDADGKPGKPFPVVQGHFRKGEPKFSYDGKWLAYVDDHNQSGVFQVYVMSFPGGEVKQQVSNSGGGQPRWRQDGKELYFLDSPQFMVVDLTLGSQISASAPHVLAQAPNLNSTATDPIRHQWAMMPDGQRMLVRIPLGRTRIGSRSSEVGPTLTCCFAPTGAGGPRVAQGGPVSAGMTVVLQWPATLTKAQ